MKISRDDSNFDIDGYPFFINAQINDKEWIVSSGSSSTGIVSGSDGNYSYTSAPENTIVTDENGNRYTVVNGQWQEG